MTYEVYRYVFIGAAVACGLMLILSIVLFFVLRIPKVISDLSGRTARKAIDNIRKQNEASGDKSYQSSAVNIQRGKVTDKISPSGRLVQKSATPFGTGAITEKISTQKLHNQQPAEETTVLSGASETTVLDEGYGETSVLQPEYGETSVLQPEYGETTVLQPEAAEQPEAYVQQFTIEYEITYVHTNEVIQ